MAEKQGRESHPLDAVLEENQAALNGHRQPGTVGPASCAPGAHHTDNHVAPCHSALGPSPGSDALTFFPLCLWSCCPSGATVLVEGFAAVLPFLCEVSDLEDRKQGKKSLLRDCLCL